MTETPNGPHTVPEDAAHRMRAIAGELTAAGLTTALNSTAGGLDLTAALSQPGHEEIEVIIDEEGYVEIRYWTSPGASPAQIASTITRALV